MRWPNRFDRETSFFVYCYATAQAMYFTSHVSRATRNHVYRVIQEKKIKDKIKDPVTLKYEIFKNIVYKKKS